MRISLLTVPVEPNYADFVPEARAGTDVFVSSLRCAGPLPIMPKIAIVSLIKWMERHGYGKDQYDFYDVDMTLPSDKELLDYFKSYNPTVVGLSAVVSTCYPQVKRLAGLLRQACPDALIVLGGSLTAAANLILRKTEVDLCVVGDGEISWVNLLDHIKAHGRPAGYAALAKIAGLAFLDDADELRFTGYGLQIPGDDNPFPDYDILRAGLKNHPEELENYFRPGLGYDGFSSNPRAREPNRRTMIAQLWSSKGCVARCTFCQRSTKGYRTLRIDALDAHLKTLAHEFNVGFIHILDENFSSDKDYAYALARTMAQNDMLWMASGVRVSSVGYEDIKFYKDHNCVSLKFGVETGSQKIMDVMEKKFTVERVYDTLKYCADLEIKSPLAVMAGMPGETNETALETGRFLGRVAHMQGSNPSHLGIGVFYALPLAGTPLYVYGQQLGLIGKSPEEEEKYILSIAGAGACKINYVNLNGAPMRDVIFWDWLIHLEAQRTFRELVRKNPLSEPNFMQRQILAERERALAARALTLKDVLGNFKRANLRWFKQQLFYGFDHLMENRLIPSALIAGLPRWLAYPLLRAATYANYLLQRKAVRLLGKTFALYEPQPKVQPLKDEHAFNLRKMRSLRSVVQGRSRDADETVQDRLAIGL